MAKRYDTALTLILSKQLHGIVEREANRRGMHRVDFARWVLKSWVQGLPLPDPELPVKPFSKASKLVRQQIPLESYFMLDLRTLSYRAANFSKSCIWNIALLEFFRVCPLWEPAPKTGGTTTATRSSLNKQVSFAIGVPLDQQLEADARYMGLNKQELIRQILRHWLGLSTFMPRPRELGPLKPFSGESCESFNYQIAVQPELLDALNRYSYRCASMSRSCVAVSFLLSWLQINPLAPVGSPWRTAIDEPGETSSVSA